MGKITAVLWGVLNHEHAPKARWPLRMLRVVGTITGIVAFFIVYVWLMSHMERPF